MPRNPDYIHVSDYGPKDKPIADWTPAECRAAFLAAREVATDLYKTVYLPGGMVIRGSEVSDEALKQLVREALTKGRGSIILPEPDKNQELLDTLVMLGDKFRGIVARIPDEVSLEEYRIEAQSFLEIIESMIEDNGGVL